jgi:uncharacterized repeat protein (TIGR01451 family)
MIRLLALLFFLPVFSWAQGNNKVLNWTSLTAQETGTHFNLNLSFQFPGMYQGGCYGEDDGEESCSETNKLEFDLVDAYNYIQVAPAIQFTISPIYNGLALVGKFSPETNYKVTLRNGIKTAWGVTLNKDAQRDIVTPSLQPFFRFKSSARYLPSKYTANISWEALNVEGVELTISRVPPQNFHQWITTYENGSILEELDKKIIKIDKNKKIVNGEFSLSAFAPLGKGAYVIVAKELPKETTSEGGYDYRREYARSRIIVTDLAVVAKLGQANEMSVWALDKNDISNLRGVDIELLSENNIRISNCTTGLTDGSCVMKWNINSKYVPYTITARKGSDLTYLRISDLEISSDRLHAGSREFTGLRDSFDAYIYSERDLYRPGENINLSAMIRNAQLQAVSELPIKWKVISPRGLVVKESVAKTSQFGMSDLVVPTSASADTGKYLAQVEAGKTVLHKFEFLVEEFVPERIGIQLKTKTEFVKGVEPLSYNIQANYLFGPPVAGGEYKTQCSIQPAFKRIPGYKDYWTGIYTQEPQKSVLVSSSNGELSADGFKTESCAVAGKIEMKEIYELKAQVDVQEAGSGRATVKSTKGLIANTENLIGLKLVETKNREIKIEAQTFNFKGEKTKGSASVELKLYQIKRNWYFTGDYNDAYGGWNVKEIIVPSGVTLNSNLSNGQFVSTLKAPDGWGQWMVRATDKKTNYTSDIVVGYLGYGWFDDEGSTAGADRATQPSELEVELKKTKAAPGDSVEVGVVAPFAGRLLLTVESDQIHESEWIDVKKPGPVTHKFKVPDRSPNVYFNALMLKNPNESGGKYIPARAFGGRSLKVEPENKIVTLKINHPEISESRKSVSLKISNSGNEETEYSVAAVDEGILQITGFKSPSPQDRFFDARRLGVRTLDTLGWTFIFRGKETAGGDSPGASGSKTMPVRLVTYWFPKVKSDKSGNASAKLDLPSFQGQLRIMVVASGKSKIGSAESKMIVRDPLVIQPTLPRFLTSKDKVQFPISVTNTSGDNQDVEIEIKHNDMVQLASKKQTLTLKNNEQKVARFPMDVIGVSGIAKIEVIAKSKNGQLKSEETFQLKIQPDGVEQNIRLTTNINDGLDVAKQIPTNWRKDYLRMNVSISNMPYLTTLSHIDHLIHYPYGCIEQTTSSTMPLLAIEEILDRIPSSSKRKDEVKGFVQAGIQRVLSMQTGDGGFGYWPGDSNSDFWGTSYATFMLIEAKKLGYNVPSGSLDSALTYLQSTVRNQINSYTVVNDNYFYDYNALPFALYVLSKGGKNMTSELRRVAAKAKPSNWVNGYKWRGITGENYFLLAAAAKLSGDKEIIKSLSDDSVFTIQLAGAADYEYTYWSSLRSDGLRLTILEDIFPKDAKGEALAERIVRSMKKSSYYYSTQEIAWAVLGLGKRIKNFKIVSDKELNDLQLMISGTKANRIENNKPTYELLGAKYASSQLTVAPKKSDAGVWLYTQLIGYTNDIPVGHASLSIDRTYLTKEGAPLNKATVKPGDTFIIQLNFKNKTKSKFANVAVVDRLPAGLEVENTRLGRGEEFEWATNTWKSDYMDVRDDRVQVFGDLEANSSFSVYYTVRAVTPGEYIAPSPLIEVMYEPEIYSYGSNENIKIIAK